MKSFIVFLLFSALISCSTKTAITENKKPNILLIVIDEQGYPDFSGFKNYDISVSTPNISRLGNQVLLLLKLMLRLRFVALLELEC